MSTDMKETLRSDFEKMMRYCIQTNGDFGFNLFGEYAVSALNFYVGSSILTISEKHEAALFLANLYNAGIRNVISDKDLQEIADVIAQDATLNYQLLAPLFN